MFRVQKLVIVVILIVGALNFGEGRKYRTCLVCTGNQDFCALARWQKILLENCFEEAGRVRQEDDGCYHHNHNGKVERGCLSRLTSAQYKECNESEWCKKCYDHNCNDEQYFVSRSTVAPSTRSNSESSTESRAAPTAHLPFGLISLFILFAAAAF